MSVQDRCTVCAKRTIASEIVLDELLGDGVMWNLVLVRLEMVLVLVQDRHMVCAKTYHRLRNHFGHTRWYSLETRLKWKLILVRFEVVRILTQDRCMVCAERTIGSKNILDAPDGTTR